MNASIFLNLASTLKVNYIVSVIADLYCINIQLTVFILKSDIASPDQLSQLPRHKEISSFPHKIQTLKVRKLH